MHSMSEILCNPTLRRFYWRWEKNLRRLLPSPHARVLGAISGGSDSVAMAALLAESRDAGVCPVLFAHVHHGLRPEADQDMLFVQDLAARLGVQLAAVRVDVGSLMDERGWSLEQAARQARHAALAEQARSHNCTVIAMAHHMDDQAETVLLRLLRGVGPGGLGAMAPAVTLPATPDGQASARTLVLIRPLLGVRRNELTGFRETVGLPFREDRSNRSRDRLRNRIRHELLPHLSAEYNPRLVEALADLARSARAESEPMQRWARAIFDEVALTASGTPVGRSSRKPGRERLVLDAVALRRHPEAMITRVLWMAYQSLMGPEAALGTRHLEELLDLLSKTGSLTHSETIDHNPPPRDDEPPERKADARDGLAPGEGVRPGCANCFGNRELGQVHLPGRIRARLTGGRLCLERHEPRPDRE